MGGFAESRCSKKDASVAIQLLPQTNLLITSAIWATPINIVVLISKKMQ